MLQAYPLPWGWSQPSIMGSTALLDIVIRSRYAAVCMNLYAVYRCNWRHWTARTKRPAGCPWPDWTNWPRWSSRFSWTTGCNWATRTAGTDWLPGWSGSDGRSRWYWQQWTERQHRRSWSTRASWLAGTERWLWWYWCYWISRTTGRSRCVFFLFFCLCHPSHGSLEALWFRPARLSVLVYIHACLCRGILSLTYCQLLVLHCFPYIMVIFYTVIKMNIFVGDCQFIDGCFLVNSVQMKEKQGGG